MNIKRMCDGEEYFFRNLNFIQFAIEFALEDKDYHEYKHEAEVWNKQVITPEYYQEQKFWLNFESPKCVHELCT